MTAGGEPVPVSLAGVDLLSTLSAGDLSRLERHCRWRRFEPGQQIISYLDQSRDVYFLITGSARAINFSMSGREIAYRDIHSGQMFGEFSALDGRGRTANVVALEAVLVAVMPHDLFLGLLERHPPIAMATMKYLVGQLRRLSERIYNYRARKVRGRILAALLRIGLRFARGNRARIPIAPKHADLASMVDTHREAVPRVLQELYRDAIIAKRGQALIISDLKELARRAGEDDRLGSTKQAS